MQALESVRQVDDARKSLADLQVRVKGSEADDETLAEIQQLEKFIADHSKRAEQAITASYQERMEGADPPARKPLL